MKVGIAFGGISPEHEVSVITSLQAAAALDSTRFSVTPLFLAKNGSWYSGEALLEIENYTDVSRLMKRAYPVALVPGLSKRMRVVPASKSWFSGLRSVDLDVVFIGLHGGTGESGGIQGLCESMGVPYTGSGVLASALAMDKSRSKELCAGRHIPVLEATTVREAEWAGNEESWLTRLSETHRFPAIVKPVSLGSSIGIKRVGDRSEMDRAIEDAFRYDEAILVENAVEDLREINCSVLGDEDSARASVLEEPISGDALLSFDDKYRRGSSALAGAKSLRSGYGAAGGAKVAEAGGMASLDRRIPAPISDDLTDRIQKLSVDIFQMLGCAGVARIDYLMDDRTGEIYFNEINTVPGSFSFYLWEPSGVPFDALVEELISIALRRYDARFNRIRSYDVNLLAQRAAGGLKSAKG